MDNKKVLIVGGVAGGASAAARLRRLNEKMEIIMFEKGEYISFANCGLPYYIGGEIKERSNLTLQTPESFNSRFNVDVRTFSQVISINKELKKVSVKNHKTGEIYEESYDKLILSPGAEPFKPNIEGINSKLVFTLRNIPDTYKIKDYIENNKPKKAIVIGGGYIGVEMSENLKNLGLDVTIVEMQNQVIAPLDFDMACEVQTYIKDKGINLMLESSVEKIVENNNTLDVTINGEVFNTDIVILSIGVRPETSIAKNAGLKLNERGAIIVSENMLTSDENIYAVGDAIEVVDFVTKQKAFVPLAGPANKQGRIAADNICGIYSKYKGTQGSSILKLFDMTVATTGINEKTAKRLNLSYDKVFLFSGNHASYYPNSENMSIKVIFEKETGKILGVQIFGFEGTDKRCDVFATAIRFGATAKDLTNLELCYAPPYSSAKDPVNMAGFVIENIINKNVKNFHWNDIESIKNQEDIILLDIRTEYEYENGFIDGFINIPLDNLRDNLDKLDKNKKIYVSCQIGLRGYIGCRILSQNGYDCYNLSGGYRLYNTIYNESEIKTNPACVNPKG